MTEFIQFVNDQLLLFALLIGLIAMFIANTVMHYTQKYKDISVNEAVTLMDDTKLTIIDTRETKERTAGHIAKDVHIPMKQLQSKLSTLKKEAKFLVYCRNGSRSPHSARALTKAGFANVYNLNGGFNAWVKANLPITKT